MNSRFVIRRVSSWLQTLAAVASLFTASTAISADPYPNRSVRLVASYPPSGVVDRVARAVSDRMSAILGQPVVVENRPGAGGVLGTDIVAKAAPDGHTILVTLSSHTINPALHAKLPFDTERDFIPLVNAVSTPQVLVAHPSLRVNSVSELITSVKAKPSQLPFASPGNGSPGHLAGILFGRASGIELQHIPYRGHAIALTDVLPGRVPLYFVSLPSVTANIEAGQLKALAVTTPKRSGIAPSVPTMREAGFKDFPVVDAWVGFFLPAKTPPEIVAKLNSVLAEVLSHPDVVKQLTAAGTDVTAVPSAQFREQIAQELKMWKDLAKSAKISLD